MRIDIHQALGEAENSLRDFIAAVLEKRLGAGWIYQCGVSSERIEQWEARKVEEDKRQKGGAVEQRLLYYADFHDLWTILKKHWSGEFRQALGERKTIEVFLDELGRLRNPHAHQRELLPHQKHLIVGMSGEIRNRLIKYRSKMETGEDYYPRLECVRDNIGNTWVPKGANRDYGAIFDTGSKLRPGDVVEFLISATDPMGDTLSYSLIKLKGGNGVSWQEDNVLRVIMTTADVGKMCDVNIYVRSPRGYHAMGVYDDVHTFRYEVLPPKS